MLCLFTFLAGWFWARDIVSANLLDEKIEIYSDLLNGQGIDAYSEPSYFPIVLFWSIQFLRELMYS